MFFIVTSLLFTIYNLNSRLKKEIKEYEVNEIERTNKTLKDFVDLAWTSVETNYRNATDKKYIPKFYGGPLKQVIDVVEPMLQQKVEEVRSGRKSQKQAQQEAIELINEMRFENGAGYVWITSNELPYPTMILEPVYPALNGQLLNDSTFINSEGTKNVFTESVELCTDHTNETNDGFIYFTWPKPDSEQSTIDSIASEVSKFGYVRLFEEWNWILGTGMYLDDAVKQAMQKSISDLRDMRYDNGKGYYWINDDTRPTPRLIMNPLWVEGEGKIHTAKQFNRAFGEDINLYEAFLQKSYGDGGFVDYKWDKPLPNGGTLVDAPKQSYVKMFEPLGWVIGSGVYIDDIYSIIDKKKAEMNDARIRMIINYLLISVTLAVISISGLIFIMNRHFRNGDDKVPVEKTSVFNKKKPSKSLDIQDTNIKDKKKAEELKKIREKKKDPYKIKDDMKTKKDDIKSFISAPAKPPQEKPMESEDEIVDVASKLLRVFIAEQSKLLAEARKTHAEDELSELSNDIKLLTQQLKAQANGGNGSDNDKQNNKNTEEDNTDNDENTT